MKISQGRWIFVNEPAPLRRRCRWRLMACTYIHYLLLCQLAVDSFILFLASSIYLFLRFCWRTTHAWLIYILLLAHTCLAYLYFTFGVHTHIVDSSIYLVSRFCWRTTHACWLIYIYLYFASGAHILFY